MARELYRSQNGDVWTLILDKATGLSAVEHTPNLPSGGAVDRFGVGEFLSADHFGPEHLGLLALLAALAQNCD